MCAFHTSAAGEQMKNAIARQCLPAPYFTGYCCMTFHRLLLEKTRQEGVKAGKLIRFIFTSSLAVYGGPLVCLSQKR